MEQNRWSLFKCQRCGQCCEKSGLPWDPNNIQKMSEFLKMDSEDFVTRYYEDIIYRKNGKIFIRPDQTRRKPCPFLGEDKNCQIYPVRPNGCKAYPIDTHLGRCGVDCPGMKIVDEIDLEGEEEDKLMDGIYLLFVNPEKEGIPCAPFAYICLGSYSRIEIREKEHIALSARCNSIQEVKCCVTILRKHLRRVLKEAKNNFRKADPRNR